MKKLIAMILAAAMLLSLTACGSAAADAAADDPEAETASADASAETPPEKPDGTPPDGANGQPGTPPDGNPPDGAPNGQPGSFGGSGTVNVDSGSYTSNGYNSPAVYSTAAITVKNAALTANNSEALVIEDASGYLMRICGNSASHGWGTAGSNGAQVEMTCEQQTLSGNILVDTISALNLTLKNGSSFTGTINITDNAEGGTAVSDNAVVTIESGCTWTLTGDCTITSLTNNGTIDLNGYTLTLADGTVLR